MNRVELEASWPFGAVTTIAIQSFAAYITHRLFHSSSRLWHVHRVHHFDTAIDVSTGLRHHPLELVFTLLIDSLVAILFGLLPFALMIYGITELMFGSFSHASAARRSCVDKLFLILRLAKKPNDLTDLGGDGQGCHRIVTWCSLNHSKYLHRGTIVGAIIRMHLGGARFGTGRSELCERLRLVQESPPSFRC
jgi:hypothetical protein